KAAKSIRLVKKRATKTSSEIPAAAVAKMTKWNEKHPDMKFSWVVIGPDTPTAQKSCKACKKEFHEGRVTRVTPEGAFCGPRCQRQAQPRPEKKTKEAK